MTVDHLARIDEARARVGVAKRQLETARLDAQATVHEAVADGVTWQQIADHLGMSRQAAHEMYR